MAGWTSRNTAARRVFLGLVDDFGRRYRLAKDASRVVDFSDLERLALQVLIDGDPASRRPSAAARAFHDRFKHVLVDEYQDINELQDTILSLLSRECLCDEPGTVGNLFCVGDVKQSIYRFRLAEAARFLDRQKRFREEPDRGELIDLQNNFRSRGPLLEAINAVFERLMSESAVDITYDESHRLRPGLKYPDGGWLALFLRCARSRCICFPRSWLGRTTNRSKFDDDEELDRSEREAVLVARRIREMMGMDGRPPVCVAEKDGSSSLNPPNPLRRHRHPAAIDPLQIRAVCRGASPGGHPGPCAERHRVFRFDRNPRHARAAERSGQPAAGYSAGRGSPQPAGESCRCGRRDGSRSIGISFDSGEDAVPFHDAVVPMR